MVQNDYHEARRWSCEVPGDKPRTVAGKAPVAASLSALEGARALWAVVAPATRLRLAAAVIVGVLGRSASVLAAASVSRAGFREAALVGAAAFVLFAALRALLASARIRAECDLYRAGARALVRADVLEIPDEDPTRALLEGNAHARALLVETLPGITSDLASVVLLAPLVLPVLPGRLLGLAVVTALAFLVVSVPARRVQAAMQREVLATYERVADGISAGAEGRLEIAARAGEERFERALEGVVARYAVAAKRNAVAGVLASRAPLAAAGVVLAAAAALDVETRHAIERAAIGDGLLLAALGAIAFNLAIASQELVRARARVVPFVALLSRPARPELEARGTEVDAFGTFELEDVDFAYVATASRVLEHLELAWRAGAPLVLSGPNGAGKSTVLRLVLALRAPTRGRVRLAGVDLREADVVGLRARAVLLPQRPYVGEPHTTVRGSFALAGEALDDAVMVASLERVGLRDVARLDRRIGELSVGQRQRLALARVLVADADLVLLDEPDANLDREGVALVRDLVVELSAKGRRVAVAAHGTELLGIDAHVVDLTRR